MPCRAWWSVFGKSCRCRPCPCGRSRLLRGGAAKACFPHFLSLCMVPAGVPCRLSPPAPLPVPDGHDFTWDVEKSAPSPKKSGLGADFFGSLSGWRGSLSLKSGRPCRFSRCHLHIRRDPAPGICRRGGVACMLAGFSASGLFYHQAAVDGVGQRGEMGAGG